MIGSWSMLQSVRTPVLHPCSILNAVSSFKISLMSPCQGDIRVCLPFGPLGLGPRASTAIFSFVPQYPIEEGSGVEESSINPPSGSMTDDDWILRMKLTISRFAILFRADKE